MPLTIRDVLNTLTADPGRPRLTWYGPDSERVELSGAVLANWVTKTTNLLVEEFDAEPGTVVALDLPPHWRTLVWALATWQAGAEVRVVDHESPSVVARDDADIVVTDRPPLWVSPDGRRTPRGELVAVSLPALARRYDGDLPAGAIDAASAVMTYGDRLGYVSPTDAGAAALTVVDGAGTISHGDLLSRATDGADSAGSAGGGERPRTLLRTLDGAVGTGALLLHALGVWSGDGSVVVLSPAVAQAVDQDAERLARLVTTERVVSGVAPGA